jgi:4-hydroxy-tetrahydrodipicolinate synthase
MLSGDYKYDRSYCAIMTPFKPGQDEVDEEALRSFVRYFAQDKRWMEECLGSIDINPGCGEAPFLSTKEKVRNLEIVKEEIGDKAPVFSGVIQPTTKATVEEAKALVKAGADGLFLFAPIEIRFNTQTRPEVWFDYVAPIFDAVGDLPAIPHGTMNSAPGWRANGLPPDSVIKMCNRFKNIVGWKMAIREYIGWRLVCNALKSLDHHVGILAAAGDTFHEHFANDTFDGTLTGAWNYAKEPMTEHLLAWKNGDVKKATEIWHGGLRQLQEWIFGDDKQYQHYKEATWLHGLIPNPWMRPPRPQPLVEDVRKTTKLLEACGIECISDSAIRKEFPDY